MKHENYRIQVLDFLHQQSLMTLSTVSPSGQPEAATLFYLFDSDFTFYFVTREETRKVKNINKNPKVAIVISDDKTMNIQVEGRAVELNGVNVISDLLSQVSQKALPEESAEFWPPVMRMEGGEYKFYKVSPTMVRVFDFGKSKDPWADPYVIIL